MSVYNTYPKKTVLANCALITSKVSSNIRRRRGGEVISHSRFETELGIKTKSKIRYEIFLCNKAKIGKDNAILLCGIYANIYLNLASTVSS